MLDTTHDHLRRRILQAVDAEVDRADDIHGDRSISHLGTGERFLALAALTEEVGELARALIDTADTPAEVGVAIVEAVQVAASAVAITHNLAAPNEEIVPGLFARLFDLPPSLTSRGRSLGMSTSVFDDDEVDGAVWTERAKRMAARLAGDEGRGAGLYRLAVRSLLSGLSGMGLPLPLEETVLDRQVALMVIGMIALEVAAQEEARG